MATTTRTCFVSSSIDLNVPVVADESIVPDQISCIDSAKSNSTQLVVGSKRRRPNSGNSESVILDDIDFKGGAVAKPSVDVLRVRSQLCDKPANVICKVEELGKLISHFDDRRRAWVIEMGFGGLLFMVNLKLPRALCYWLMTRVDPMDERLDVGGVVFRLTSNQVRWVLGIPKGDFPVPFTYDSEHSYNKIASLENKYGHMWTRVEGRLGKRVTRMDFSVTQVVLDRLMGPFDVHEEQEFKALFLMAALDMVLCPTQCSRYPRELLPALSCAQHARNYNWCALVLDKLMASAKRFASRFKSVGYVGGCGGCTLFLALFYLDHLNRNPVLWGIRPRIKVWTTYELKKACDRDRVIPDGDYGHCGVIDIAYGEIHPNEARDVECPSDDDAPL